MKLSGIFVRSGLVGLIGLLVSASAVSQERKLKKTQVPEAVLAAFVSAYPYATVRGYGKETENGKVYYEVESIESKTTRDVLYNPDGTVAEIEEGIVVGDLPAEATKALHSKFPRAVITSAERITRGDITEYEAHAKVGKRRVSMEFDANGKPLKN